MSRTKERPQKYLSNPYVMSFKRNNDNIIVKVLNHMCLSEERWIVDDTQEIRSRMNRVRFPLSAISVENAVKVACYSNAVRATAFISAKSREHNDPKRFLQEIDKLVEESDDYVFLEAVNVLKTRIAFLTKMGVIAHVFAPKKREAVKRAVERAVREEEDGY